MDISDNEKKERIALAEDLDDVFFYLFALILLRKKSNKDFDITDLTDTVIQRYKDVLVRFGYDLEKSNAYLNQYVENTVESIVESTVSNISDLYYLSSDRAEYIAENEANSVKNFVAFQTAIKQGKTKKKWITKRDSLVRHTHTIVDGEEIGIYDAFEVGDCFMLYPKDIINGTARECVNCRCVLEYSGASEPKEEVEKKEIVASVDEMHIGTTDDMLHIGTTDDEYLHIGAVTDMLHIGTTDDPISDLKDSIEKSEQFELIENIKRKKFEDIGDFKPLEVLGIFMALGYKSDESGNNYTVEIDEQTTFEYYDDDPPYYVYRHKGEAIVLNIDGSKREDS